ncbi:MAG: GNAT family N-acetyltransferase [Burkholderiales bacterium]|nr:GNAT family N-acetyltransferase [Burkholderiales bacterium]
MTVRNLHYLFAPKSVAIIGASKRPYSVGATVLRNIVAAGFHGKIYPVNPKYDNLADLKTYPNISRLPEAPELAVICTPPATIPELVEELGRRGTKAAIVLTAGLGAIRDAKGKTLKQAMLDAAKPYLLRILGPNCVGLLVPGIGLNASFAHTDAIPGKIAFVSQSGALVTGILDWAKTRNIGFSRFISLGDSADVDFGDVLDFLASDADTSAILLYVEDIKAARKFMSAARAAARSKPVLVLKAGRSPEGAKAAASHTGALAGADDVYDAAIRRAGMLRVYSTEDLFDAVETLARAKPMKGDRLAIVTNGGGPGVMATDALMLEQGKKAALSDDTLAKLNEILPSTWSHGNPIDIIGDAPPERYVKTMEVLMNDHDADALLFIHAPTAIVPSLDIARAVAPLAQQSGRNILSCWLGGNSVAPARALFAEAGIPTYDTPEDAVRGFMQIVRYQRNQDLLMQVPATAHDDFVPDRVKARSIVAKVIGEGRDLLTEAEAKDVLAAYGVPIVATRVAQDPEEAARLAGELGFPVALKVLSKEITHKSDVGGVALDLESADAVRAAGAAMKKRIAELRPTAVLQGFTVQAMLRRPDAHELIVGVTTDPVFGPVIMFGQGGTAVEVMADRAIALPPLNMTLARDLISRTRVSKLLAGYRNRPPADMDTISRTLIQISHLITDIAQIAELDINPLLADSHGAIALDARIRVMEAGESAIERMAIRPYPNELEERIMWHGEPLLLRPIMPEDGPAHMTFFQALAPQDVHYRFFGSMRELSPAQLARLTQIDYDREMAFIASRQSEEGRHETLGVVRVVTDPDNVQAEFAVIVRSDVKGLGLGTLLMKKMIAYCKARGTVEMIGEALAENHDIIELVKCLGFEVHASPEADTAFLKLPLNFATS